MLAEVVKKQTGAKVRGIELSCFSAAPPTSPPRPTLTRLLWPARRRVGRCLRRYRQDGGLQCTREGGKYTCQTVLQPLDIVANLRRRCPASGSTPQATVLSSPSLTMLFPDPGCSGTPKSSELPRFAALKRCLPLRLTSKHTAKNEGRRHVCPRFLFLYSVNARIRVFGLLFSPFFILRASVIIVVHISIALEGHYSTGFSCSQQTNSLISHIGGHGSVPGGWVIRPAGHGPAR